MTMEQYQLQKLPATLRGIIEDKDDLPEASVYSPIDQGDWQKSYNTMASYNREKAPAVYQDLEDALGLGTIKELADYNFDEHVLGFSIPVYKQGFVRESLWGMGKIEVKLHEKNHIDHRYDSERENRLRTKRQLLGLGIRPRFH